MSTQPTDAEIDELWRFEASKNWSSALAMRTSFTRAALAKWGTPAPVGVEPVSKIMGMTGVQESLGVAFDKVLHDNLFDLYEESMQTARLEIKSLRGQQNKYTQ